MSHDHLVRKQALLDYKKRILHSNNIVILWLTRDFGQNMEILSLYVFVQMVLEIMFDDH